jgi:hypothetical protein
MKAIAVALMLVLSLVVEARASVWEFSWVSEWTGRTYTTERGFGSGSGQASGQGTATIADRPGGGLLIEFDSPAGPAQLGVDSGQSSPYVDTRLPFNVPADNAGGSPGGLQLLPGEPQPFPYGREFQWTGDFKEPDSFSVDAIFPGSGPSPMLRFSGTGTRRAEASAPEVMGLVGAALAVLVWLRRTGRV